MNFQYKRPEDCVPPAILPVRTFDYINRPLLIPPGKTLALQKVSKWVSWYAFCSDEAGTSPEYIKASLRSGEEQTLRYLAAARTAQEQWVVLLNAVLLEWCPPRGRPRFKGLRECEVAIREVSEQLYPKYRENYHSRCTSFLPQIEGFGYVDAFLPQTYEDKFILTAEHVAAAASLVQMHISQSLLLAPSYILPPDSGVEEFGPVLQLNEAGEVIEDARPTQRE